jgi:hypothetical protein
VVLFICLGVERLGLGAGGEGQEGCRLRFSSETSWLSCIWVAFLSLDDRRDDAPICKSVRIAACFFSDAASRAPSSAPRPLGVLVCRVSAIYPPSIVAIET